MLYILSVGGSIIVPEGEVDVSFLKSFKKMIVREIGRGNRFVVVTGGGGTSRRYQAAARKVTKLDPEDIDWLGIHATRLNGHLMRTILRDEAHPIMYKNPMSVPKTWEESVLIVAGWKPGWSTDYIAVRMAKRLGASMVFNLSNIEYVYDADPRKNSEAKPMKEMNWKQFRALVGDTWDPGMNVPFDPIAARLAHESGLTVTILNGRNIPNIIRAMEGKSFKGTVVGKGKEGE